MAPKSVLITGCSEGGVGDALAQAFHRKGLRVFASARDTSKIKHLVGMGLEPLALDVTDSNSIKSAVENVKSATGGKLDFLVNNAGALLCGPLLDIDISAARHHFDLNVFSVMEVTQAFFPLLIASKGTVINIGSVAGLTTSLWQGYYNASKAALAKLTDQLRMELKPFEVKAILVITGPVKSHLFENQPPVKIPESSFYAPAKDIIDYETSGAVFKDDAADIVEYANEVASNALKKNPQTHQLAGGSAWTIWFLTTFFWHTIWDEIMPFRWNFAGVVKRIRGAKKTQ